MALRQTQSPTRTLAARGVRTLATLVASAAITLGSGGLVGVQHVAAKPVPTPTVVDFSQCANGTSIPAATSCTGGWINGILNHQNSTFFEDQVTAQRLEVLVPAGAAVTNTITIRYQTRKGSSGNHAYDSLATWNYTLTDADHNQGLTTSEAVLGGSVEGAIPPDPTEVAPPAPLTTINQTSSHQLTGQVVTAYGATDVTVDAPIHDCTAAGTCGTASVDDYADVTIHFTVSDTSVSRYVQILFGGHLAASLGPRGWGAGIGSAFISGGPYHFKWIAVDNSSIGNRDNQIQGSSIFVSPTIGTAPNPSSGSVPLTLNDSATLSGAVPGATGTILFSLFGPADSTCAGPAVYTQSVNVSGPGTYNTSPGYSATTAGTYHWTAAYSGDGSDAPVTSGCADEPVTVSPASPSITTQASPTTGTVGVQLTAGDTATFVNAYNPTGSVTFTLYSDSACTVSTGLTGSGTISNGSATFSGSFTPTAAGTYYWKASYAGDANNNGFTTGCGDANEQLVISQGGTFGYTPGFWQGPNGHSLITSDGLLPFALGVGDRTITIVDLTTSDLIIKNSACQASGWSIPCSTGFSNSLTRNKFESLAKFTLAMHYNIGALGSSFAGQSVVAMGATIPTSLTNTGQFGSLALTNSSTVQDVFNLAQFMVGHSASTSTNGTTVQEAVDMASLLSYLESA